MDSEDWKMVRKACYGILMSAIVIVGLQTFDAPKYVQYAVASLFFLLWFELDLIRNRGQENGKVV